MDGVTTSDDARKIFKSISFSYEANQAITLPKIFHFLCHVSPESSLTTSSHQAGLFNALMMSAPNAPCPGNKKPNLCTHRDSSRCYRATILKTDGIQYLDAVAKRVCVHAIQAFIPI